MDLLLKSKVAFSNAMEVSELGKMNKMLGDFNPYVKTQAPNQPANANPSAPQAQEGASSGGAKPTTGGMMTTN